MDVVIIDREELKVVGIKIRTTVDNSKIPQLWNYFVPRIDELSEVAVPECSLGICLYEGEEFVDGEEFSYLAAVVVKNDSMIPEGMEYYVIPKTKVAVFTHTGSTDNLAETYNYIFEEWLPQSGYQVAEADDLEWYDNRFTYGSEDSQMDIHIPIKLVDDLSDEDLEDFLGIFEDK